MPAILVESAYMIFPEHEEMLNDPLFQKKLGLPVVLLGFTPPDDNAHAPNESMDLANFEGGIRAVVRAFDAVAAMRDPRR